MRKMNKLERRVFRALLFSEEGLDVFSFFRRFRITPSQLHHVTQHFLTLGFVIYRDNRLFMSEAGREWAHENRRQLQFEGRRTWRDVPEEFIAPQLPVNKPFVPKISQVHRRLLEPVLIQDKPKA